MTNRSFIYPTLLGFGLIFYSVALYAQESIVPQETAEAIIKLANENFWGNAENSKGQKIYPSPGQDPTAPIIPSVEAFRIVDSAFPVGLAMRCNVKWKEYYLHFMKNKRGKNWNKNQIAYIGFLFGLAQGTINRGFKNVQCTSSQRNRIDKLLNP